MITINDRFSFERADQCWELHELKDGINPKTKEPVKTKQTTYHGNVLQICNAVIDRDAGSAESLSDLINTINESTNTLKLAVAK